jgi:hypothetical protein
MVLLASRPARAGIGIRSLGGRVGLDVVQSEDTRTVMGCQVDLGTLFGSNLHVEPSFEHGKGGDVRGEEKRVSSFNVALKYVLEDEKTRAFAYFSGEIGVNLYSAVLFQGIDLDPKTGLDRAVWTRVKDARSSFNLVLLGLGRKIARNRMHVFSELKFVLGEVDSDTSFRVSAGIGYLFR